MCSSDLLEWLDGREEDLSVSNEAKDGACSHMDGDCPYHIQRSDDGCPFLFILKDQPQIEDHECHVYHVENRIDHKHGGHVIEEVVGEKPPELLRPPQIDEDEEHGSQHQKNPHEDSQSGDRLIKIPLQDIAKGRDDDGSGAEAYEVNIKDDELPPGDDIADSPNLLAFEVGNEKAYQQRNASQT